MSNSAKSLLLDGFALILLCCREPEAAVVCSSVALIILYNSEEK